MKNKRITYRVVTGLFCLGTLMSVVLYATKAPNVVMGFHQLGYPYYFINVLGTAKALGLLVLLVPAAPLVLREWAYAGLVIDALCAFISSIAVGAPPSAWAPPLLFTALAITSYILRKQVYPTQMLQPGASAEAHG